MTSKKTTARCFNFASDATGSTAVSNELVNSYSDQTSGLRRMRLPEVLFNAGISKSKLYDLKKRGQFPKSHHTGRISWFYARDIYAWLAADDAPSPVDNDQEGDV